MTAPPGDQTASATQAEAAWYRFRPGCLGFGGPAAQNALVHRDVVEHRRWVSEREFLGALNACLLLPGPEARQLATWLGWRLLGARRSALGARRSALGARGGCVAGPFFILPGWLLALLLAWTYVTQRDSDRALGPLATTSSPPLRTVGVVTMLGLADVAATGVATSGEAAQSAPTATAAGAGAAG